MNEVILVTGSGKGGALGFEVCRQLAKAGLTIVLTARSGEDASARAEALHGTDGQVIGSSLDVTDAKSRDTLVEFIRGRFGVLDALINNALTAPPLASRLGKPISTPPGRCSRVLSLELGQ